MLVSTSVQTGCSIETLLPLNSCGSAAAPCFYSTACMQICCIKQGASRTCPVCCVPWQVSGALLRWGSSPLTLR